MHREILIELAAFGISCAAARRLETRLVLHPFFDFDDGQPHDEGRTGALDRALQY